MISQHLNIKSSMQHHIFLYILTVLFLIFGIVQFNDPDPWLWIGIYFGVSLISILANIKYKPNSKINGSIRILTLSFLIGLFVYASMLIPEIVSWINNGMPNIAKTMKTEEPHIEYTREFFGLILSIFSLFYCQKKLREIH